MDKEKEQSMDRTASIWPEAGQKFDRFLRRIEEKGLPRTLAVLGSSDGNYVLPAARRGFEVLAIDIDEAALYGGTQTIHGILVETPGLAGRLKTENLEDLVRIVCKDYITYNTNGVFSGVFTSGSIHYQDNSRSALGKIISKIQSFVAPRGLLNIEYIKPSDENSDPLRHFVSGREMASFFPNTDWKITSNKGKRYLEDPNPRNNRVHEILWGRLYAERLS